MYGEAKAYWWELKNDITVDKYLLVFLFIKINIDIMSTSKDALVGYLTAVQESILFSLATLFEEFLRSDSYS